jgi:hypothetical protein
MSIDGVVERLSLIPGARVGHGPRHPQSPDAALGMRVAAFFDTYPALRRDGSYVEFQEKYAGALIEDPEQAQIVDIFGFDDAGTDILDMEGPVVNDDGFLVFAQCIFHTVREGKLLDTYEYDFAFNVNDDQDLAVYQSRATLRTLDEPFTRYIGGFLPWLEELVARSGRYERPPFA